VSCESISDSSQCGHYSCMACCCVAAKHRLGMYIASSLRSPPPLRSSGSSGVLAGFLAETIQGVGGAVQLAEGYLPAAYEARIQNFCAVAFGLLECSR
jgi:4-aminobutyrate aminotransferase-like enzyme